MADNLFTRLGRLFQSNVIIRKADDNRLVVKDLDFSQTALKTNFIDRYNRMIQNTYSNPYSTAQNRRNAYEIRKLDLFKDYEMMDQDPIIASALDIYSDESTVTNIEGEILKVKSENTKVQKILHNLFYDVINVEFNLWSWIRNMTKYGDFYLQLDIVDKYGVVNVKPISAYEITRLEDHDPANPQLIQFEIADDKKEIKENYEIAHFRVLSDTNFLPYGRSMLENGRKIFKQLTLMEDAMLIHRIMRAPEKRVFKIDVGNIPPREVEQFMQRIINKMKKTPVIDQATGDYNLKYNVESVTEDYFLPVRGGDSGTEIDTLPGLSNNDAIDDIEYLKNKLMASLRIPKAFLGYEEGLSGGKATLAAEDVRFARTIERLQKIIVSELTKIGIVHLYSQGFDDSDLIDFSLELQNPSMIHEQEKLELMTQQVEVAERAIDTKLFSREWLYDNVFDFSDEEKKELFDGIVEDTKQKFRLESIENEGQDPADQPPPSEDEEDIDDGDMARPGDWGGSKKDPFKDRDTMKDRYGHESLKDVDRSYGKREFKGKSPLATSKASTVVAREGILDQLKDKFPKKKPPLLSEDNIIKE
nr:phage portal vertex protein [uncultured Mediterranean phage uvMED]